MSAKRSKKFAQAKLNHEMFKKTLENGDLVRVENIIFDTDKHQLQSVCVNKIALGAYKDKRYISSVRKTTLPFGHFSLRHEYITKKMCVKTDWDLELNEPYNLFEIPEGGEASGWENLIPAFINRRIRMRRYMMLSTFRNYLIKAMTLIMKSVTPSFSTNPNKSTSSSDSATLANISKRRKKTANVNINLFKKAKVRETLNRY